ncbi:MAG: hypothetical protein AUI15_06550 [Actinobacteria bacterium 13_2_20CM_2_66_6]|nr:MAG: hypothetical protein AUI15_06550 [Actinobacteria bacterium 13_2_20CM_2_66_6]
MKAGIDAHMVGGHETGNETYVKGLIEGFKSRTDGVSLAVYNRTAPWTAATSQVSFHRLVSSSPYMRLGVELPLRSLIDRLDVLHMTYAAPIWSAAPVVLTVHDICFVTNPEWFSERDLRVLRSNVPRSIRMAAHVITVSADARARIIEAYRLPESRITAIPNGPGLGAQVIDPDDARSEISGLGLSPGRPYVLTVGNLQPRKNIVRLIKAFEQVTAHGHDLDLVIAGPRHYRAEDAVAAAERVQDRVRFTGYLTDRQLAACYRCATAFVFPSLYEGFGLPAIEAMSHGVPSACSNAGALPEVCGDAALLFDPTSVEAMADALTRLLDDTGLRERLRVAGPVRAALFSWTKSAEQTARVYAGAGR